MNLLLTAAGAIIRHTDVPPRVCGLDVAYGQGVVTVIYNGSAGG